MIRRIHAESLLKMHTMEDYRPVDDRRDGGYSSRVGVAPKRIIPASDTSSTDSHPTSHIYGGVAAEYLGGWDNLSRRRLREHVERKVRLRRKVTHNPPRGVEKFWPKYFTGLRVAWKVRFSSTMPKTTTTMNAALTKSHVAPHWATTTIITTELLHKSRRARNKDGIET